MTATRSTTAIVAFTAAVAIAGIGIGLVARGSGDDGAELRQRLERSDAKAARLEAERDRLRLERNQLEARLAAGDGASICPDDYVTSGTLLPLYAVDYPCGWHVLFDPTAPVASEDRPGLRAEALLITRVPISLAPRAGPVADLELVDWTDDPNDEQDMLPPLTDWLAEERARFSALRTDDSFEAGDGITVHRLIGEQDLFDDPATVHVLLWRYDDAITGTRHIARAFALAPSARAAEALERLARSFRPREP